MLGVAIQNLVVQATWPSEFMHSSGVLYKCQSTHPIRITSLKFFSDMHSFHWNNKKFLLKRRSQRPLGLRRGSAAARLLRLLVRIPPRSCTSVVSVVCCQVEVSGTS